MRPFNLLHTMTRYQGEDIEFALKLTHLTENDMQSWNSAKRVVAYLYTHTSHIAKYSSKIENGYYQLTKASDIMFTGVIPSVDTKVMRGALYCDIYIMPTTGDIEQIRRVQTGIKIVETPIKIETT